jgi:hypothetical protein
VGVEVSTRKKHTGEPGNGGEFGTVHKSESSFSLDPPSVITPEETEALAEHRGRFVEGYDSEDIERFADQFTSVEVACTWEYIDSDGFGGDSEILFREVGADSTFGPWCRPSEDVHNLLFEADSDVDPESIASIVGERCETQELDEDDKFPGGVNFARRDDIERCAHDECDESLDDGEGWNGYCGTHADKIENHNEGDHEETPDDDCPECD